jgi:hypothetical protein
MRGEGQHNFTPLSLHLEHYQEFYCFAKHQSSQLHTGYGRSAESASGVRLSGGWRDRHVSHGWVCSVVNGQMSQSSRRSWLSPALPFGITAAHKAALGTRSKI